MKVYCVNMFLYLSALFSGLPAHKTILCAAWTFPYFIPPCTWGVISIQAACRTDSTIYNDWISPVWKSQCVAFKQ